MFETLVAGNVQPVPDLALHVVCWADEPDALPISELGSEREFFVRVHLDGGRGFAAS